MNDDQGLSRINELYQIHFRYYFNVFGTIRYRRHRGGALDAEKLDKTTQIAKYLYDIGTVSVRRMYACTVSVIYVRT